MPEPKPKPIYKTGFCGGYNSPPNHKLCPHTIRHAGDKIWTCACECHEETK